MKTILIIFFCTNIMFALTNKQTKHLLNRTSFGYTKQDLIFFKSMSKKEAINYLIYNAKSKTLLTPPKNIYKVSTRPTNYKSLLQNEKKKLRKIQNLKMNEIRVWWIKMMLNSKYSFREKMTLFWHNHFVSEYIAVKNAGFMYQQNIMLRENSLGNFKTLLNESSKDLAMLIYLDNNSNKKSHPNENFARELLELFTLGEGHYTEKDIKENARAFSGWRVNRKKAIFRKVDKLHDNEIKTFLNQSGNFDGEDIINIILQQRQTSKFIITKLYKEFISENINTDTINTIALAFQNSNYDISLAMRLLLNSDDFWNNRQNLIKSPIELIVSLSKILNLHLNNKDYTFITKISKKLGQELFNPPNVKGWIGGKTWIDTNSVVNREAFIKKVIRKKIKKKKEKHRYIKLFIKPEYQLK